MPEQEQLWQYLLDNQQCGPVPAGELQQLAAAGTIGPETFVWTEGLEDWIPASQIEGLFAAAPQAVEAVAESPPGGVVAAAPLEEGEVAAAGDYPPTTFISNASYGLLTGLVIGAIVLYLVGLVLLAKDAATGAAGAAGTLGLGALALGGGVLVFGSIVSLIYLHRAWKSLQFGMPRCTPGKAVGFLFIPFFNLYWIFVAYYGLAQDWNRIRGTFPNLATAPRLSEGVFLTYCIGTLVFPPLALIMFFVMYKNICKGVNFMASRHLIPGQAAPSGGLKFY